MSFALAVLALGLASFRPAEAQTCTGLWGDVTADSDVNIIDAQQIARFAAQLSAAQRVATQCAPSASFVYVLTLGSNSVSVIATATNTVVATVVVGLTPIGIILRP